MRVRQSCRILAVALCLCTFAGAGIAQAGADGVTPLVVRDADGTMLYAATVVYTLAGEPSEKALVGPSGFQFIPASSVKATSSPVGLSRAR